MIGITTAILGMIHNKKWFVLAGIASGFLLQHALQGWCPPLPVIRQLGVNHKELTTSEMLKALILDKGLITDNPVINVVRIIIKTISTRGNVQMI